MDSSVQAAYLENVYRLAESYSGTFERVFWFCWSDGMVVPPFGAVRGETRRLELPARRASLISARRG